MEISHASTGQLRKLSTNLKAPKRKICVQSNEPFLLKVPSPLLADDEAHTGTGTTGAFPLRLRFLSFLLLSFPSRRWEEAEPDDARRNRTTSICRLLPQHARLRRKKTTLLESVSIVRSWFCGSDPGHITLYRGGIRPKIIQV